MDVELADLPDLGGLYARAARTALPIGTRGEPDEAAGPVLADTRVGVTGVAVDLDAVADYAEVCGFGLSSDAPATYPHLLGFPLAVWLMTREDFPFDLLGTIHLANRIVVHEPLPIGTAVDVTARLANLRPHRRGWQFEAVVEVHHRGRLAWESASTNLRRGDSPVTQPDARSNSQGSERPDEAFAADVDPADLPLTARWRVPADIGRRYGAVSGDRNPIHLSTLSARPFGFSRAIAHGMWTKARALAGLGRLDVPCTIDVAFRKPVYLPSTVDYATARDANGWRFGLRGRDGRPHLAGTVTAT